MRWRRVSVATAVGSPCWADLSFLAAVSSSARGPARSGTTPTTRTRATQRCRASRHITTGATAPATGASTHSVVPPCSHLGVLQLQDVSLLRTPQQKVEVEIISNIEHYFQVVHNHLNFLFLNFLKTRNLQVFAVLLLFKTASLQPLVSLSIEAPSHLFLTSTVEPAWAPRGPATSHTTLCCPLVVFTLTEC